MKKTFVISSGRTGTVFLTERLPSLYPELHAVHEPSGSRSTLVAANTRNLLGRGTRWIHAKWRRELDARLSALPEDAHYLEVNPMLIPFTDVLETLRPLRLIHLTRHPRSWTQSIRTFKASTKFRPFIDYLPLSTPYPVPRPRGWFTMSQVDKALWRWRYSNEQILALRPHADFYLRLRYEDLFSADLSVRDATLALLLEALDLAPCEDATPLYASGPANPSPPGTPADVPQASLDAICGPLAREFGYS